MRKQVVHVILFGLMCASGFAQRAEIFGEPWRMHLRSSCSIVGCAVRTGNFEGAGKNTVEPRALERRANGCASERSMLLEVVARDRDGQLDEVAVWQFPNRRAFFFVSGMTIDADGAPNAYNSDDTGLDELTNAGTPAHWNGIITDREGNPLIQQESDPFPGYYISCTSLSDKTKKFTDPSGYVDASRIPYVALPGEVADRRGARLGDFALVMNLRNGKSSFAIFADIGTLGEGSVALADALGIRSDARRGGQSEGILYLLFPGSGNLQPRTLGEIKREGERLLLNFGGRMNEFYSCVRTDDFPDGGGGF